MKRVLFLDIDGVLNGHDWCEGARSNTIRKTAIEALNYVLQRAAPSVVLSSAWRYIILGRAMKPHGFEYLLRTHGAVGIAGNIVGTTCADEDCAHCGTSHRKDYGLFRRTNCRRRPEKKFCPETGAFICPACTRPSTRGDQIRRWLTDNRFAGPYVVLDDEDYGIKAAGHPFVQTDGACGLTLRDARKAVRLLKGN
jgi:hypothetical protein